MKTANALVMLVMTAGMAFSAAPQAQAHDHGGVGLGIAAGIIGLGVLGAAASAHERSDSPHVYSRYDHDACYYGPRECHWTNRSCYENGQGDTVCRGGRETCERPLICE